MKTLGVILMLAALSACGSQETKQPQGAAAFGEVLPGSASDAMLPYDTATSAPPLEAPTFDAEPGSFASRRDPGNSASDAAEADAGTDAEPAPEAS